ERDYSHLELMQGRLPEAAARLRRSMDLIEKSKGDGTGPAYRRRLGLLTGNLVAIEHRQAKPENLATALQNISKAEELFRGLVNGNAEERHPYDDALLAATLNVKAMIERDLNDLTAAEKTHKEAVTLLDNLPKTSRRVNVADLMHFAAHCRMEQSKTWAKTGKLNYLANSEKNITGVVTNLGIL